MPQSHNLPQQAADAIAARLAALPEGQLRLPHHLRRAEGPAVGTSEVALAAEVPEAKRREYLLALLLRDPGVFLERHGELLTAAERSHFECLRSVFEVDFYLKLLEDQEQSRAAAVAPAHATSEPGPAQQQQEQQQGARQLPLSPRVKNRRLAAMNRLLAQGQFFSDGAMRRRQPALHHQYIGQYRSPEEQAWLDEQEDEEAAGGGGGKGGALPPAPFPVPPPARAAAAGSEGGAAGRSCGRGGAGAGGAGAAGRLCTLSGRQLAEGILRRQEELEVVLRREEEQQRWADRESESEEEEEEEEEEGGEGQAGHQSSAAAVVAARTPSAAGAVGAVGAGVLGQQRGQGDEEMEEGGQVLIPDEERAEYSATFLDLMKQRFLHGQDAGFVDYRAIDGDAGLDEDWAAEERQDAEDRYFDDAGEGAEGGDAGAESMGE